MEKKRPLPASLFSPLRYRSVVLKIPKVLAFTVGGICVLAVLLLVGANLYLQSEGVQSRIRQATTASLGVPVEIGAAMYFPWSGLTLSNITAPDPAHPGRNIFEARSLNVRLSLWQLLSRKVVITSISLREPVMTITGGRLPVPLPPPKTEVILPEDPNQLPEVAVQPEPETEIDDSAKSKKSDQKSPPSFSVEVQKFRIRDGTMISRSPRGRQEAAVSGLNVEASIAKDFELQGVISAAEISLQEVLFLRDFRAPFVRSDGVVNFADFSGAIGAGTLKGSLSVDEKSGNYELQSELSEVQVPELVREAGLPHRRTAGVLNGIAEIQGKGEGAPPEGFIRLNLLDATIEPVDFIRQLGQLLSISELQLLQLENAHLFILLAGGSVLVEELVLETENLAFLGAGLVEVESGELDLQGRLLLNEHMQRRLRGFLNKNFVDSERKGYKELAFKVYGPINRPETDLVEKLAGKGSIGAEVGRFLQNLIAPPTRQSSD